MNRCRNQTGGSTTTTATSATAEEPHGYLRRRNVVMATVGVVLLAALYSVHPGYYSARGSSVDVESVTGPATQRQDQPSGDLYSVVFDAGSTGSRMFVFHFKLKDDREGESVLLEREVFEAIEPGISSYAKTPSEAADSLAPLLQKAVSSVPVGQQNATLITLKATAGLRLLPKEKGDQIMAEVRDLMKSSPFLLPDPSKIMVMGGEEEDVLWDSDPDNTVATFDLGGGSMQVTFELSDNANLSDVQVRELYKLKLLQAYFLVFTYSYLGSGLKSGRLGIMGRGEGHFAGLSEQAEDDGNVLLSPCFPAEFNTTWRHGEHIFLVKGTSTSSSGLKLCKQAVDNFVHKGSFIKNKQLHQRELHLFSYYFDVARWAGLIPESATHKLMTPADFLQAAEHYCVKENMSEAYPFLCMDLLYIYSMLTEGFGLAPDRQCHVEQKILGREVSWSLGAALSTLSQRFTFSAVYL
ncbi:ectonucleoside triphosphate diphosphohydrolase 5 isoform X2 [Aplysia californica]|uniref:Ectonucleoside triphosphate diphosphohydrolase 5 isoform X2 n=1 Tax=Aplysia californica TaxID=6500 RepID=A0ABM1A8L0_APLCA|nr:ectonucleoside triphosphate diphosphohydrolase 5 isoform X2 [Aplysia californica]